MLASEEISVAGAEGILQTLSRRFKIGVVTSSRREHFSIIHERTGFSKYFDFIVAEGDYTRSKPDPEPYSVAVKRSGFSHRECLAIEDSPRGLKAATGAGLECWVVPSELTAFGNFSSAGKVLSSICDLPGMLFR
jgi:HAD superfamily hydrolase (TIGR01509 family)